MYISYFILLSLSICCSSGLNILVIFPHSGKSHFLAFEPMFRALAKKGHNLTVISYFPQKKPIPNYRDVSLEAPTLNVGTLSLDELPKSRLVNYEGALLLHEFASSDCPKGLQNENLVKFLREDNKFDVILAELFNTNCFLGVAKKFQAPVIGLSSTLIMPWTNAWLGNPSHPAYIPNIFMDYSDQLTFLERLENTLMYIFTTAFYNYALEIQGNKYSQKYIGEDVLEDGNIVYNISLLLTNSHFTLNLPRPLVPSAVEVGGVHVGTPKRPPANIEKWLNEATDGVIYFCLGSLIKSNTLPREKMYAFLNTFKRLPQRVLWKWDNETMEGKPDNVMIQKWVPQLDVLCHPNVKAFMSHGGLLGTIESVHCGVPMVIMPQFGDQFTNARAVDATGGGVILKLNDVTEETVYNSLKTVLNPEFRDNAKALSERFRDRPLPPLETAIYWTEYVARHKGAHHMRTAAVNMPWYQYYLIDVISVLLLIFSLFIYMSYAITKFVIGRLLKLGKRKVKSA